jgi:hypothetical protein
MMRTRAVHVVIAAVAAIGVLLSVAVVDSGAQTDLAGSAGTDTSLPATDSAVTVRGRGGFSDLEISVNQTENLTNQAVSLSWTGGTPTMPVGRYYENYLQIMQCWGEDDGTNAENPGPPPEQCVSGATTGSYGLGGLAHPTASEATGRIVSFGSWPNAATTTGFKDPKNGFIWRPFRAVDGTVVNAQYDTDFNPSLGGGNYWQNPYFDIVTTNELAGSRTRPNGTGADLFEVNTGVESSGLGCGQRLEPAGGGDLFTPKCWIVVVPRGSAAEENVGSPYEQDASRYGVMTSPLSDHAWSNRIAIPLDFNPVDSVCDLGLKERRIVGTELIAPAVGSWQPALCSAPGRPPYSFASVSDTSARQQILTPTVGSPGMAVVSSPVASSEVDPSSPAVYAPLSLSGMVIGFNIERSPLSSASQASQDLSGVRVADINLTPRLVAKLLSQSYRQQVEIASEESPYEWVRTNPTNLAADPDFLQFNPEFETLQIAYGRSLSGLIAPGGNSDAARQVWEWILADPEARRWLDGEPDPFGMVVNPVYATQSSANSSGVAFGDPAPVSFPKGDPYCLTLPKQGSIVPPPLCATDWMPFSQSLRDGALMTRAADDRARVGQNPFAVTADQFWGRGGAQVLGRRATVSITDSVSAAKYGIQTARLSRAGDNGSRRTFVAPDTAGLLKGVAGMAPETDPLVLEPDPLADVPDGYPLTTLTYGMIRPLSLDAEAREDYAAFIEYAATDGQTLGLEPGELPRGYASLPQVLRVQAAASAALVREMQAPAATPEVATSGSPTTGSSRRQSSAGSLARSSSSGSSPDELAAAVPVSEVVAGAPEDAGPLTPILALARSRYFIPIVLGLGVLATLGALEITKRPRRSARPAPPPGGAR